MAKLGRNWSGRRDPGTAEAKAGKTVGQRGRKGRRNKEQTRQEASCDFGELICENRKTITACLLRSAAQVKQEIA